VRADGAGRSRIALLAAAAWLLAGPVARAAEWTVGGRVYQQLGYNDNIRLRTDNERDSAISVTAGEVELRRRTPTLLMGLDAGADGLVYFNESNLNTTNQLLRGLIEGQGQRSTYGLDVSLRRDSDIVDQFDGSDVELDDRRRTTFAVGPSFSYLVTRRDRFVADGRYTYRNFDDDDRPNFDIAGGSVGWRRQLTRRLIGGAQLYGSHFDSARQQATFVSPQLYLGYAAEERIDLSFAVGPSFVEAETQRPTAAGLRDFDDSEVGYAIDSRLRWAATATTDLEVALTRLLEPSGSDGEATETTRLRGTLVQRLTRNLRFQLDTTLQRRTAVGDDTGFQDRDDVAVQPRLRWALTEDLEASINYRWRYRDFDDGGDAVANAVFVRLTYELPERRLGP
jgi:hypothetical protein